MGGELYRTVLEASSALRAAIPDDHREAPLRQEVLGLCVLTAPFNLYTTVYPYGGQSVPRDARIRTVRQVINNFSPFVTILQRSVKRGKRDKRRRDIKVREDALYGQLSAYAEELRGDDSRTAHFSGWDYYALGVRIAVSSKTGYDTPAFHIGKLVDEKLEQAYADNGLIREGHPLVTAEALVREYTTFERILREVYDGVCRR